MNGITPAELQTRLQHEKLFLLDVREAFEHADFNIGGQLIPLGDIIN